MYKIYNMTQLTLPIETSILIPANDISQHVNEIVETIPLNELRHFTNYIPAEPYLFEYLNGQQNIDYLIQLFDLSEKYNSIMNSI